MDQHNSLETNSTKIALLDAAKNVLLTNGYSGLSTRAIAASADTQMSQIRYHFGSKEGLVLALYEYMTAQLIERQTILFTDSSQSLSQKWDTACDYLDEDIASGYVRVFQELIAQGWSNPKIAQKIRNSLSQWFALQISLAQEFKESFGSTGPIDVEDIAVLVSPAFAGVEAFVLLGWEENGAQLRRSLRRFGNVIRYFENNQKGET